MSAPELSLLAAEVRRHDRDRFITALFAPAERREAIMALYAFNLEIARTRESVSETLLGEIRLQWWRDAVEKLYGGSELAHPVVHGLAQAIRGYDLSRMLFDRLIDARAADLNDDIPLSLDALEGYADGTASTVLALAVEVLGTRGETADRLTRLAGTGWGLVGMLRAAPFLARERRVHLPADLLAREGVTFEDVVAGRQSPGLRRVAATIADRARRYFQDARAMQNDLPRRARSPLLVVQLGETYLSRLRAAQYNLFDIGWSAVRPPMLKLTFRALTTGY